jgi:hypothetical protein
LPVTLFLLQLLDIFDGSGSGAAVLSAFAPGERFAFELPQIILQLAAVSTSAATSSSHHATIKCSMIFT